MQSDFQPKSPEHLKQLIDEYPLAWMISQNFDATPLPLLGEVNGQGELVSLLGHMARRNPQYNYLQDNPDALILFMGPHAYISPNLLPDRNWAPTWNYAVVRMKVVVDFVPEETDYAVSQLVLNLEAAQPNPWSRREMGRRYEKLAEYIVAFRATISSHESTFKLGQDETPDVFEALISNHSDDILTKWMADHRQD
tara:strand:- start:136 stop:723 length:588 start_codon:yes stop_codon:yes gene_type:complete